MTIARTSSKWSQAGAAPVQLVAALAIAAALVAAYWGIYTTGSRAGAATVKQQWDRDTASRALRTAEQTIEHRTTERALIDNAATQQRSRHAQDQRIAAVHAAVAPLVAAHLLGAAMALTPEQHRAAMFDLCLCKITDQATNRMKTRTAKQQLADALAASAAERKPPTFPTPDDGDDSSLRTNMLT